MKKTLQKISALLLCLAMTLVFSGTSKVVYAETGTKTMSLVDELAGALASGYTSNKILVRVENGTSNPISAIQVCMTNLVLNPDQVDGISFNASINNADVTIEGLLGGSFQKINGNDHCFVYQNLSDGLVAINSNENTVKITVKDENQVVTGLTSDSSLSGNGTINTDTYTVSANEHPTFKEIWLQVEDGTLGSQQMTVDGNDVYMLKLYDGQNTIEVKNVVRDNPYIYFKVSDPTDTRTNVVKSAGDGFTLGTNNKLLDQDINGFYSRLNNLEYSKSYNDLELKLYDDQMTALTATSLNGLSFVTQLDTERPTSVTDAIMTQESDANSVITFTKSTDNSAVSKYYLVEKGALENAQVFDESNGINSSSLLGKIEQLKIKEVVASNMIGTSGTISFAKDDLTNDNSSDKENISNNQFLVVAMDDAHTVAGDPAGNFSQVVDDSNWFYVQRKGDFDNDGKANLVDVVKFARYYMGATDSLY